MCCDLRLKKKWFRNLCWSGSSQRFYCLSHHWGDDPRQVFSDDAARKRPERCIRFWLMLVANVSPELKPWRSLCLKSKPRTSLVVRWLRIHLLMQRTQVRFLGPEDPTCCKATWPVHQNYWTCALQQEKPLQWENCTLTKSSLRSPQPEKAGTQQQTPSPDISKLTNQ